LYHPLPYVFRQKAIAPRCVTFVLPFYEDKSDGDSYLSDFEDEPNLDEEAELALEEDIILLKNNNNASKSDSKLEDGTGFIDIEEYLERIALEEPLLLPPAKIPKLSNKLPLGAPLKAKSYYNDGTRI
jgi:hypothetical protein